MSDFWIFFLLETDKQAAFLECPGLSCPSFVAFLVILTNSKNKKGKMKMKTSKEKGKYVVIHIPFQSDQALHL